VRILVITIILMVSAALTAQNPVPPSAGDGTIGNPYQISTLDNLYWIASNTTNWDKYFIQTADIDASSTSGWFPDGSGGFYGWVPIGTEAVTFTGSYNGQNFTISGIYLNRTLIDYTGLFGYLGGDSVLLRNINLVSVNMYGGINYSGGLAGCYWYDGTVLNPTIENCSVSGTVSGGWGVGGLIGTIYERMNIIKCSSSVTINCPDTKSVGGLIGYNYIGTVSECSSSGNVTGNDFTGGLIGYNETGTVTDCFATGTVTGSGNCIGGLIGYHENSAVTGCYASGNVTRPEGYYIGGLVGYSYTWDYGIDNCYATGNVSGYSSIGGLVGYNDGILSQSYSTGNVTAGGYYSGGLAGKNVNSITDCYSHGNVTGYSSVGGLVGVNWYSTNTIKNCYSTGTASGTTNTGGFIGSNYYVGIITDCFWDIETSGTTDGHGSVEPDPAGITGKTTIEMKTKSTFTDVGWNFADVWGMDGAINDGYAYLQWQFPTLEAPEGVTIVYISSDPVLSWQAVTAAVSYKVYSSTDPYTDFGTWTLETEGITDLNWIDTDATETKKFYAVVAVN